MKHRKNFHELWEDEGLRSLYTARDVLEAEGVLAKKRKGTKKALIEMHGKFVRGLEKAQDVAEQIQEGVEKTQDSLAEAFETMEPELAEEQRRKRKEKGAKA